MSRAFPPTHQDLSLIATLPRAARIAALERTLRVCDAQEAEALGLALVELTLTSESAIPPSPVGRVLRWLRADFSTPVRDLALRAVLQSWPRLSQRVRDLAVAACRDRWVTVADQVSTDQDPHVRLALAEIAGLTLDPAMVPSVGRLLSDPDASVARAADRSFALLLKDQSVRTPGAPTEIEQSFADALRTSATVRATDVAKVVASLMDRAAMAKADSPLAAFISDPNTDLTPIQATLRRAKDAVTRQRAFEWLNRPRLAAACVDALANARLAEDHARVLALWHLLGNPARATRLRLVRVRSYARAKDDLDQSGPEFSLPASAPCPLPADIASLPVESRRGLSKYVAHLDADGPSRLLLAERFLIDPDAMSRLQAVTHAPSRVLADFCFDRDPCVARAAALRLSIAGSPATRGVHARLDRAPQAWVRRVESEDQPGRFAVSARSAVLWRQRLDADRAAAIAELRTAILDHDSDACVGAVMLARRLRLVSMFESELTAIAGSASADPRAVASAVAALGELPGERSAKLLGTFTSHADERVRANAVEGLALALRSTHAQPIADLLTELKSDPNHRVRANALRPLVLESPSHIQGVCSMMRDDRAGHRLAGAWLASRLIGSSHADQLGRRGYDLVIELKRCMTDPDAAVRRRAEFGLAVIGDTDRSLQGVGA